MKKTEKRGVLRGLQFVWRKLKELRSVSRIKHTKWFLLFLIVVINAGFIFAASIVLTSIYKVDDMSYPWSLYHVITMILDAGCIQEVVVPGVGKIVPAVCLVIIFVGTLIFTGGLIGFATTWISGFIDNMMSGKWRVKAYDHTVILNWNTRASEIINDLLYTRTRQKVVVLVQEGKDAIIREVEDRLSETIRRERVNALEESRGLRGLSRLLYLKKHFILFNNVTVIVREGDVFSTKQLEDISLKHAKAVIILGSDISSSGCRYAQQERADAMQKGNALTVKTLMRVADITAGDDSRSKQVIIVEITDDWTLALVESIKNTKENGGDVNSERKNKIVPLDVNKTLGQLLAQFSLMPELNNVYYELFSNKGASFFCEELVPENETTPGEYLDRHFHSVPLSVLPAKDEKDKKYGIYVADTEKDGKRISDADTGGEPIRVELNPQFSNGLKNIVILGHNSKMKQLLDGFENFRQEWRGDTNELKVLLIDDESYLEKAAFKDKYPFVSTFPASVFEKEKISETVRGIISSTNLDISVLILSDDGVAREDIDANALTYLVYLQDIILEKLEEAKNTGRAFDYESIDVIVEIIDPKHYDVVDSYSRISLKKYDTAALSKKQLYDEIFDGKDKDAGDAKKENGGEERYAKNNVVISNRYISKMITQISESYPLYSFYQDILTYDNAPAGSASAAYSSYEIYLKSADGFFKELPGKCTAAQLIRAVYSASVDQTVFEKANPTVVLGYVRPYEGMTLFSGDQRKLEVELRHGDKLIVYSLH